MFFTQNRNVLAVVNAEDHHGLSQQLGGMLGKEQIDFFLMLKKATFQDLEAEDTCSGKKTVDH